METHLKIEHLAPCLPHNTMMVRFENGRLINTTTLNPTFLHEQRWDKVWKLALHPLSDLTKPIKVEGYNDGKEFVPIVELKRIESEYPLLIEDDGTVYFTDACVLNMLEISRINKLFQLLYQWHFDLEGLIESDLAIDINTLNK